MDAWRRSAPGSQLLVAHVDEAHLRRNARGEEDLEFLRSLRERSHINVPLRSRGRNVGTLALLATSHLRTAESDLEFAQLLAGRIGLALDNAGLFAELESLQGRLTTALGHARRGGHDPGRPTAASSTPTTPRRAALGFDTAEQLLATPPREIVDAYESFNEDGVAAAARGAARRARLLAGRDAGAAARARASTARTGEERWRIVKATPCRCARASRGSRST